MDYDKIFPSYIRGNGCYFDILPKELTNIIYDFKYDGGNKFHRLLFSDDLLDCTIKHDEFTTKVSYPAVLRQVLMGNTSSLEAILKTGIEILQSRDLEIWVIYIIVLFLHKHQYFDPKRTDMTGMNCIDYAQLVMIHFPFGNGLNIYDIYYPFFIERIRKLKQAQTDSINDN